jgi:hypothetical protein
MRFILLSFLFVLFFGCENSDNVISIDPELSEIVGKWQFNRYQYSIGGPPIWEDADTKIILEFNSDLTFTITNNEPLDDKTGIFRLQNDTLIRVYNDDPENIEYSSKMTLSDQALTLIPLGPNICIEGCASEYKKID